MHAKHLVAAGSHGALSRIAKAETPGTPLFIPGGPEAAREGFPGQR